MDLRCVLPAACCLALASGVVADDSHPAPTMADVVAASQPSDWRPLDPEYTLYLQMATGRIVIELAPAFAPEHVANIRTLVRQGYFDGLAIYRSQDNFVVQWGGPDSKRGPGKARATLPPEFTVEWNPALPLTRLPDVDGYAPVVGFSGGFPVGADPQTRQAWLAHCYGMIGAGRDNDVATGNGAELYVVIGHAPRYLDRNVALVGRVVRGMELLSALPRGTGPLGYYAKPEQHVPISSVRLAADMPTAERERLEVMRTDTPTFAALIESRRNRRDAWYKVPAGHVELCTVPIVARPMP